MADSELNIRVTTIGTASIEEIIKNTRELAKERNKLSIADKEHIDAYNAAIRQQKELVLGATEGAVTANGRMMRSYFSLGEQLRRYYMEQRVGNRTLNEVTRTASEMGQMFGMGGLGSIIGNATAQFQQMEFAISALGIAAKQGTGAVASFGQKLMGWAVPIGVAAAGFGLLKIVIDEATAATERLDKAIDENTKSWIASGKISKEQQVSMITGQIATLKAEKITPGIVSILMGRTAMAQDILTQQIARDTKINELYAERKRLMDEIHKAELAQIIALEEIYDETKQVRIQYETITAREGGGTSLTAGAQFRGLAGLARARRGGGATGWMGTEKTPDVVMKEATREGEQFANTMQNAFSEATNTLAQGFQQAFGLANNLAGQFISTILSGLAQIAAQRLTSSLLDMLGIGLGIATGGVSLVPTALFSGVKTITARAGGGWINEPIVGMGTRSKGLYTLAEHGPEYVSPNPIGQAGRYGGVAQQQPLFLRTEISGSKLAIIVESGNRQNSRRRIK